MGRWHAEYILKSWDSCASSCIINNAYAMNVGAQNFLGKSVP